jgi:hypothetical protein
MIIWNLSIICVSIERSAIEIVFATNLVIEYRFTEMQKRNSQKKLNGELILMQNELMSKLANLNEPRRHTD